MANQEELNARQAIRREFNAKLQTESNKPEEVEDEGVIYYRWHYSDGSEDDGIQEVANKPSVRWLLYTTGIINPGMFYYSINQQDLVVDPLAGTPRIGPFAPPIRGRSDKGLPTQISDLRNKLVQKFKRLLDYADSLAKKKKQPNIGQIHCRWHFTDNKITKCRPVRTVDNTEAVRDLFTEYLVRYPNQFWVSRDLPDLEPRMVREIYRPIQGTLLPPGEGPSTSGSTAGTGQTHDQPLPTGQPPTKKAKPSATVSVPPPAAGTTTPRVIFLVPTDSGPEMAQVGTLDPFMGSDSTWTYDPPVDTGAPLSSAADPVPLTYMVGVTAAEAHLIEPEEADQAIHPSELTAQPIGALAAASDDSSGSALATNDPNFGLQFMNPPTGGTEKDEDEAEGQE